MIFFYEICIHFVFLNFFLYFYCNFHFLPFIIVGPRVVTPYKMQHKRSYLLIAFGLGSLIFYCDPIDKSTRSRDKCSWHMDRRTTKWPYNMGSVFTILRYGTLKTLKLILMFKIFGKSLQQRSHRYFLIL